MTHSLNVYSELVRYSNLYSFGYSNETLAIVGLFHDLCKVNFYTQEIRNRKKYCEGGKYSENGKRFDWVGEMQYVVRKDDPMPLGHGEKSLYLVRSFINLRPEEALAIRWHMGFSDMAAKGGDPDLSNAFQLCPLAVLLHLADNAAVFFLENQNSIDLQKRIQDKELE